MMKTAVTFIALLLFATCAQAQRHHPNPSMEGSQGYINSGWGGGYSSLGYSGRPVSYEPPREFAVSYVRNDGEYVPTTYMKYEDALALGRQQLAIAQLSGRVDATPSLGDVARTYRAVKVPTLRLQAHVLQDNSGKLQVCNLNGNDCHRP